MSTLYFYLLRILTAHIELSSRVLFSERVHYFTEKLFSYRGKRKSLRQCAYLNETSGVVKQKGMVLLKKKIRFNKPIIF